MTEVWVRTYYDDIPLHNDFTPSYSGRYDYFYGTMTMCRPRSSFWIDHLGLLRHPEGGWFIESYRSKETIVAGALPERFEGDRSFSTAIHFLLEKVDFSALHRLKSDEVWHFYDGSPLTVHSITPEGDYHAVLLGRDPERGERLQAVVPAGCWFGATTSGDFSLVGCTVSPGFDFLDFEMAGRARLTALFPRHARVIAELTRD